MIRRCAQGQRRNIRRVHFSNGHFTFKLVFCSNSLAFTQTIALEHPLYITLLPLHYSGTLSVASPGHTFICPAFTIFYSKAYVALVNIAVQFFVTPSLCRSLPQFVRCSQNRLWESLLSRLNVAVQMPLLQRSFLLHRRIIRHLQKL